MSEIDDLIAKLRARICTYLDVSIVCGCSPTRIAPVRCSYLWEIGRAHV